MLSIDQTKVLDMLFFHFVPSYRYYVSIRTSNKNSCLGSTLLRGTGGVFAAPALRIETYSRSSTKAPIMLPTLSRYKRVLCQNMKKRSQYASQSLIAHLLDQKSENIYLSIYRPSDIEIIRCIGIAN